MLDQGGLPKVGALLQFHQFLFIISLPHSDGNGAPLNEVQLCPFKALTDNRLAVHGLARHKAPRQVGEVFVGQRIEGFHLVHEVQDSQELIAVFILEVKTWNGQRSVATLPRR